MSRLVRYIVAPILIGAFLVAPSPGFAEAGTGKVTGRIACGEGPCSGVASLWKADGPPPDPSRYIVVPSSVIMLQPDGAFEITAPPGTYYVGAILRKDAEVRVGPPREGDKIFMSPDPRGEYRRVEVSEGRTLDVGVQQEGWIYRGFAPTQGEVGIMGHVFDMEERPVGGLLVFAFADGEMSGSPLAVSERTGRKGEFNLRLPGPGKVYLRVMENYGGGRPAGGGYMGVFGGAEPQAVTVKEAETVQDLRIEVIKIPPMRADGERRMQPQGR